MRRPASGNHGSDVTPKPSIQEVSTTLDAEPSSAGRARRFLTTNMEAWGLPDLVETGSLVIDELVTNAVLHGLGPIVVRLVPGAAEVTIEVHDGEARLPVVDPWPDTADLPFGRGLHLVEASTREWGARPTDRGKVVWAVVARGV